MHYASRLILLTYGETCLHSSILGGLYKKNIFDTVWSRNFLRTFSLTYVYLFLHQKYRSGPSETR